MFIPAEFFFFGNSVFYSNFIGKIRSTIKTFYNMKFSRFLVNVVKYPTVSKNKMYSEYYV